MVERALRLPDEVIVGILNLTRTEFRVPLYSQPFQNEPGPEWWIDRGYKNRGSKSNWRGYRETGRRYGPNEFEEQYLPVGQWLSEICPYGRPGDKLWIQEAWASKCDDPDHLECLRYRAGYDYMDGLMRWKPSTQMPREYARLVLRIDEILAYQIQETTLEQAQAEGFTSVEKFREFWDRTCKYGEWEENPWIYRFKFYAERHPIDRQSAS